MCDQNKNLQGQLLPSPSPKKTKQKEFTPNLYAISRAVLILFLNLWYDTDIEADTDVSTLQIIPTFIHYFVV